MSYRDLLDNRVVIRQSAPADHRPELSPRPTPLAQPPYPGREPDAPAASIPADSSIDGTPGVILVKSGIRQVATRVREILYVEAARNYVRIHLDSGAVIKSRGQIDRFAQHLGPDRFLRIHRGRLVNVERIRSVRPLAGGQLQLTLTEGSTIIVARDRRRAVLAAIIASAERR